MEQPPPQPPWGNRPQQQPPQQPQQPWGDRPPPPQQQPPWGYRPPPKRPPGTPRPWYRHPVGMLLIGAVVVTVLALIVPAFTGGGQDPAPTVTTGAFGAPGPTAGPAATTSTTLPQTVADQLRQAAQTELREAGEVTGVTAPAGGRITVTWDIRKAGSAGLTKNNARFGVMRIMRAIQQTGVATDDYTDVRLIGRYQLPGAAAPTTVVRLRFDRSTVGRAEFDDRRYLEAFELADAAVIHPAFRG